MPVSCKLTDGKWIPTDKDGKGHGKGHDTEDACKKQASAINANMEMGYNVIDAPKDCDFCLAAPDTLLFEKQHAYPGPFRMKTKKGPVDFELTEDAIEFIASESQRYLDNGNQCNLPVYHTEGIDAVEANRGLVKEWYTKPDSKGRLGLFTKVEFRDAEAAKLAKTAQTSIFAPEETEDGAKNKYIRAATHVALTGRPVIPGLDGFTPIAASLVTGPTLKETQMPIKDLAESIGLQLSAVDIADESKASKAIADKFESTTLELSQTKTSFEDYKKLNPPKSDPVRVNRTQLAMLRENRELKLSQLVKDSEGECHITPAVKKELEAIFCGDATLTLALSEDVDDGFDAVVQALKLNDPLKLSEATGPQGGGLSALIQSDEANPMRKVAKKRAAALAN